MTENRLKSIADLQSISQAKCQVLHKRCRVEHTNFTKAIADLEDGCSKRQKASQSIAETILTAAQQLVTTCLEDAAKHLTAFNAAVAQCQSASEAATVSMAHQLQEQQRSSRAWLTDIQQRKNGYGPKP